MTDIVGISVLRGPGSVLNTLAVPFRRLLRRQKQGELKWLIGMIDNILTCPIAM